MKPEDPEGPKGLVSAEPVAEAGPDTAPTAGQADAASAETTTAPAGASVEGAPGPESASAGAAPAPETASAGAPAEESFADLLAATDGAEPKFAPGDKTEATVVALSEDCVFLDLGTRAEGQLPREQILVNGEPSVAPGDRLTVFVTGHREGAVRCALRLGVGAERPEDREAAIEQLRDAQRSEVPVEGKVQEVIKGGFKVSVLGQRGFCPISQIERGYCDAPDKHVGETYEFAILEIKNEGRDVVLSRRTLLEAVAAKAAAEIWDTLEVGAILEGTVTSLQSYGAFVDIGSLEGLIHVSEISHTRVQDPAEVLQKGQAVRVQVKDVDRERKRVGLSLKALAQDPWSEARERVRNGAVLAGRVVRLAQFGAFVELLPGVEGLVHISKIVPDQRINHPRDVLEEGQEISVRVLGVEWDRRRISLERVDEDAEEIRAATEQYQAEQSQAGQSMGTLGDLLKAKLKQK